MISINMFSSADKVAGQGVGSAYLELMGLLRKYFPNEFKIKVNDYGRSNISHYHTIDPQFFLSTWAPKRGRKIGYVHFLPDTLDSSLTLPAVARVSLDKYVISFYKRMDHLVVVNPNFIPRLAAYGIDPDTVTYIPNFVATKTFHPETKERNQQLREDLALRQTPSLCSGPVRCRNVRGLMTSSN